SSWPPSGDGLTSGVAMAERCEILIACCDPLRRRSGLPCATAFSHAFVASRRSRDEACEMPNSIPWLKAVCPLIGPYPFCGTTLRDDFAGSTVQSDGTDA